MSAAGSPAGAAGSERCGRDCGRLPASAGVGGGVGELLPSAAATPAPELIPQARVLDRQPRPLRLALIAREHRNSTGDGGYGRDEPGGGGGGM